MKAVPLLGLLVIAWCGWRMALVTALMLVSALPAWAEDDSLEVLTNAALNHGTALPYQLGVGKLGVVFRPEDTHFDNPFTGPVAQATDTPGKEADVPAAKAEASGASASELNK